jgi:hypothetical protein
MCTTNLWHLPVRCAKYSKKMFQKICIGSPKQVINYLYSSVISFFVSSTGIDFQYCKVVQGLRFSTVTMFTMFNVRK